MKKATLSVILAMLAVLAFTTTRMTSARAQESNGNNGKTKIELYDNCMPSDPNWIPSGGCTLSPKEGNVSFAEFNQFLTSSLAVMQLIGHPSWRIEPSYATVSTDGFLDVENEGGRLHTFTQVANFGGGRIGGLNQGQIMANECRVPPGAEDPTALNPGASRRIQLSVGEHKFQCCIHPWMRSVIRVESRKSDE